MKVEKFCMTCKYHGSFYCTQPEGKAYDENCPLWEARKYNEIQELYEYCKKIGIDATIEELFDGYVIKFPSGGDIIQHYGSYGNARGCVEPAIKSRLDYTAVPLEYAKALVKRHKERLNKEIDR